MKEEEEGKEEKEKEEEKGPLQSLSRRSLHHPIALRLCSNFTSRKVDVHKYGDDAATYQTTTHQQDHPPRLPYPSFSHK